MSVWSEFRSTVGLPVGRTPWAVLCTVPVLLIAGGLLQERVTAPSLNELDYSELCRFIEQGKVDLGVIKGQAVEGALARAWQGSVSRGALHSASSNVACVPPARVREKE
jgi:hypothetical protein